MKAVRGERDFDLSGSAGRRAWFWDAVVVAYGRRFPHHPRKWRVCSWLARRAKPTWGVPRRVTRDGISYELHLQHQIDRSLYYLGHERWETRALRELVQPGWVVLDVGANIGYYTLLFSRLVGPSGRVYALEPAQATFDALRRNLALNPSEAERVRPVRVALGDRPGTARLTMGSHHALARLATDREEGGESVPVTTLDRFASDQGISHLHAVKVDIEGGERRFLEGGAETLSRCRPLLMLELNPGGLRVFGTTVEEVLQQLHRLRYTVHRPSWRGLQPLKRIPDVQFLNVIALPR